MRGACFIRSLGQKPQDIIGSTKGHLLDYISRSQRHVTRSTFSAELFAACDACDHALLLATTLHEIANGAITKTQARALREQGGHLIPIALFVDAMSVQSAVSATFVKVPAEKSLLSHVQYLRELLDNRVLHSIIWQDTRDMLSDGLTKGAVDRTLLHQLMAGEVLVKHESKLWQPNVKHNVH